MKKKFFLIFLMFLFLVSLFTRFVNISRLYTETDDQIAISQLLKYKSTNFYEIANEQQSLSYDNRLKKIIREIEGINNPTVDKLMHLIWQVFANISPSKHSTFAPLQYFIFGWMINSDQNYNELKFFSRLPSVIFSILTIVFTFLVSKKIFAKNEFLKILPVLILVCSFSSIYITQRSYNYSAGVFSLIGLCYLFLVQNEKNKNSYFNFEINKIKITRNFFISSPIIIFSYLNYMLIFITPIYFIINFLKIYLRNKKKFFNLELINLIITGLFYTIFLLPLLFYMLKLNLNEYGMTASTAGADFEYSINSYKNDGIIEIIKFYFSNIYLIISENLSYFLKSFKYSNILKIIIFSVTMLGIFISFYKSEKNNYNNFFIFFICCFALWLFLAFFNITAIGPTRHLQIFTPFFGILFTYSIYKIINTKYLNTIVISYMIFMLMIFSLNYKKFEHFYTDLSEENFVNNIIKNYNVGYISNHNSFSDFVCNMKSVQIEIQSCPIRFSRHNNTKELNEELLIDLKNNSKSIFFLNKKPDSEFSNKLLENNFQLIFKFYEERFNSKTTPLEISKNNPNQLIVEIYN